MEPEIFDGETDEAPAGEGEGAGDADASAVSAVTCLACGAGVIGAYCATCGQKNDDLRRNSLVLFREFMRDTFGFDSRMWRTLGLLVASPGLVPANYAHGRRSRYTPPVRLFLVASFLFFLTIGLTQTLFVALEVTPMTEEQVELGKAAMQRAQEISEQAAPGEEALAEIDGEGGACEVNTRIAFFKRAQDMQVDEAVWDECANSMLSAAQVALEPDDPSPDQEIIRNNIERILGGVSAAVSDPVEFNSKINAWLPRVMLMMTPVLAILISMFFRGRGALFFDHLVLSLYSHAVGFAVVGGAIIAGQFRIPNAGVAALAAMGLYFVIAMKRSYGRGWIKTIVSSAFIFTLYLAMLSAAAMWIVSRVLWRSA